MAIQNAKWFDMNAYLNNKLAQVGSAYTMDSLVQALNAAGFVGEQGYYNHFMQYGHAEDVSPSAGFSASQYYIFKAASFFSKNVSEVTAADAATVKQLINNAGMDAWTHYQKYGTVEQLNASNTFDTAAYLQAKADVLNASSPAPAVAWTAATVATAIQNAGMSAYEHFMQYKGTGDGEVASTATYAVDPSKQASNPGQSFTLTVGADSFTGASGNDTFTAANVAAGDTWTVGDAIDGGEGVDTFNVTQTNKIVVPAGTTVKNIETANMLSGTTANVIDATSWTGLTSLNVTGVTAQTVTAAATTDISVTGSIATGATSVNGGKNVTVTETGASGGTVGIGATTAAAGTVTVNSTILATAGSTGNAITVTGGTDVSVTQKGANAVNTTVTDGAVVVNGNASTTTVTVTADKAATAAASVVGHVNGAVTVTDLNATSATAAGTIATVTLNNFAAATIDSSAISTLNLTGTATSLGVGRGALTATPTANTLAVNVNGLTMTGALTDTEAAADDGFTTVNIASSTAASSVGSMAFADATTLNISGDAAFTSGGETLTAVTAINVTNTAGAKLTTALGTDVSFTGGAGADSVSLGATTKAITMGAGNDTVATAGAVGTGGSVDAGDGIDTIVMSGANAATASGSATFNSKFTNFEELTVSAGAAATINLAGINNVATVNTAGQTGALVLNSFLSGGTVNLTGATGGVGGDVQAVIANAALNPTDVVNFKLTNSTGATVDFGKITAAGVETINISTVDAGTATSTAATLDTALLTGDTATKIVVSGNNGLDLSTSVAAKVTTFDASAVVGNGTDDTAANLAVKYTSDNATATDTVSITGGAGNDTLIGNAAKDNIVGGNGNDAINGKAGVDTLTGGAGVDTFTIGAGEAGITGAEKITDFSIALGGDNLHLATTVLISNVTNANVTSAVGGAVDVTATVKDGIITLGGADVALVDTVGEIKGIFEVLDADNTAEAGAIVLNGVTYVITDSASGGGADTVNDIIQLAGVTTAVSLSTTDAANSILIS